MYQLWVREVGGIQQAVGSMFGRDMLRTIPSYRMRTSATSRTRRPRANFLR